MELKDEVAEAMPGQLFQTIFEKSPGSLVVMADRPRFTIVAVSDEYLSITSSKREDVVGKGFFEVFPDDNDDPADNTTARRNFEKVVASGRRVDVPTYRYDTCRDQDGIIEPCYWSCSNVPLFNQGGQVVYILNTVIDITAEVTAKEKAIESEYRLRMATEATGLAMFDWDVSTGGMISSTRLAEILGKDSNSILTRELIREQIIPEDRAQYDAAFDAALQTGDYAYDLRISGPDNTIRWIRTKGRMMFNSGGEAVRILGTVLDITESKRDEIRKNDFIAMASHELKTPLTSVKAFIQLLKSKALRAKDEFAAHALARADSQLNRMTTMIYSFLDMSRLEAGKLLLSKDKFDLNRLITDAIEEARLLSDSYVFIFNPAGNLEVFADREKIAQVLTNLIGNAMKYSPKGTTITLMSEKDGDTTVVSVTDEGVGIAPADQEKLFERFYRVESESMKNVTGFGIGLYLASEILQRHNGKIWVKSTEGNGSSFYFSLPSEQ